MSISALQPDFSLGGLVGKIQSEHTAELSVQMTDDGLNSNTAAPSVCPASCPASSAYSSGEERGKCCFLQSPLGIPLTMNIQSLLIYLNDQHFCLSYQHLIHTWAAMTMEDHEDELLARSIRSFAA